MSNVAVLFAVSEGELSEKVSILSHVRELFGAEVAALSRMDLRPGYFTHLLNAAYTAAPDSFDAPDHGTTCCAAVVDRQAPVVIDDTSEIVDGPLCPMMLAEGLQAYLGVPIFMNGVVIGALEVMFREPKRWRQDDIETLSKFARIAEAFLSAPREDAAPKLRVVK